MQIPKPTPPSEEPDRSLTRQRARLLLRRLRDADWHADRVAISASRGVRIEGCDSVDEPVEGSLRYAVREADGHRRLVHIGWDAGRLSLRVDEGDTAKAIRAYPLFCDEEGRAVVPEIQARVHPERGQVREIEHFLRRLLRSALAA